MTDDSYDEESTPKILKSDALGRVRTPASDREAILDAFEESGLSGAAFARAHGIKYCTFATWRQKRKKQRGEYPITRSQTSESDSGNSPFTFLEVIPGEHSKSATPDRTESRITIDLGGGMKMDITSESQAALAARFIRLVKG